MAWRGLLRQAAPPLDHPPGCGGRGGGTNEIRDREKGKKHKGGCKTSGIPLIQLVSLCTYVCLYVVDWLEEKIIQLQIFPSQQHRRINKLQYIRERERERVPEEYKCNALMGKT